MKLKPFRDYSEHDVINLFALDTATGEIGTLVKVAGSGFINGSSHGVAYNINSNLKNVYTPRWEVKAKVTRTASGEKPLGFLLYDVKETNFQGISFAYDPVRKAEAQVAISGEAVPVARKGTFLVGDLPTGSGYLTPIPGRVAVSDDNGAWKVAAAGTSNAFGVFLGIPDADGYTLVAVDFNNANF